MDGSGLHGIAQGAGLVVPGDESAGRWTGELVSGGYMRHNPPGLGDRRPIPHGAYTPSDLWRFSDYRVTYEGRTEAERVRQQRRQSLTDAALGGLLSDAALGTMTEPQRQAISVPLMHLRTALDSEQYAAAVGSAKDLAEAASKIAIEAAGGTVPTAASLPALFKEALRASAVEDADGEIGRSLTATVQRLAELRNAVGSGHGRASQPGVSARAGRLAASAAVGITAFLLGVEG